MNLLSYAPPASPDPASAGLEQSGEPRCASKIVGSALAPGATSAHRARQDTNGV